MIIVLSVTAVLLVISIILLGVGSNSKTNSKKILKDENYKESSTSVDNSLNNTNNDSVKVDNAKTEDNKVDDKKEIEKSAATVEKLTNSKIKEFLGIEKRNDGNYLKLLRENDTIEYIKYFDAY